MPILLHLLACVLPAVPASSSAFQTPQSVRAGAHFRVVCHFENDAIANAALETAEAAWVIAAEVYGGRSAPPPIPFAIHLYRTAAEYEAAEAGMTAGWFKENLSFSDHLTKSAHVAVQPQCSDAIFKTIGLPTLTRHLVAHEAAHLASYALWESHRSHPGWLAEGFATWVGAQTLARRGWSRGFEEDPFLARGLVLARDLAERNALPGFDRILRGELSDLDRYQRYAVWQTLFQFLRSDKQSARANRLLAASRDLDGGSDYTPELARAAVRIFGDEDGFAGFDRELRAFALACQPRWDEVQRALDTAGDGWLQQAFPEARAVAWRAESIPAPSYVARGELEILPGGEQELSFLIGRRRRGFVAVAFRAGYGVTVAAYEEGAGVGARWEKLARVRTEDVAVGRRIPFRIEVETGKVRIDLGTERVLDAEVGDRPLGGAWGLSADAGSTGIWRRIDVTRR